MRLNKKISSLVTFSLIAGLVGLTGSTAQAAPVGANFVVTADDLRFIMTQIKISEAHATKLATGTPYTNGQPNVTPWTTPLVEGSTVATDIPNPDLPWGLRQVDGRNNNLTNTAGTPTRGEWGAADTPFPRLTAARWRATKTWSRPGDAGTSTTYENRAGSMQDADPRLISNLIVDQSECNPAALAAANNPAPYTPCGVAASVASASADGTNVTFVTNSAHSLTTLDKVSISGVTPSSYNIEGAVTVLTPTSFSIANTLASGTAAGTGGKVTAITAATKTKFENDQPVVNQSPNGKSAPSSGIFTIFGQFFDHGLDLVGKSSTDIVFVPLKSDDPLYVAGGHTNFMAMSRTILGNGRVGSTSMAPAGDNSTTPYVDQNQTYTSIASHQVFLREYSATATGPKPTGAFLDGVDGGLATWKDIKTQSSSILGINLVDTDISNVPNLLTNEFGKFLPGPNGLPMMAVTPSVAVPGVTAGSIGFLQGSTTSPVTTDGVATANIYGTDATTGLQVIVVPTGTAYKAIRTGHAFLNDINHCAVPGSDAQSTSDCMLNGQNLDFTGPASLVTTPPTVPFITPAFANYSPSLLESHFITGDGRGNENIGLTAIHTVFHSEHNRLINDANLGYKKVIATEAATLTGATRRAYVADWVNETIPANATPAFDAVTFQPYYTVGGTRTNMTWNGEHLFQAARFANEMEYQHLVFAEFVRMIEPAVAPFAGYDINVRSDIYAEFAHAVYRYGHSQLTDMVDRTAPDGTSYSDSLFNSFLNPAKFNTGPSGSHITAQQAVGGLARGMSGQTSNEIDEFVTSDLRNSLLGIPLDLATLNLARGRDAGVGSLNQVRSDLLLKPYDSWYDYGNALRNPESLVNFIAAYATSDTALGATVVAETSINGKRGAATDILTAFNNPLSPGYAAAASFMYGVDGNGVALVTGVDSIDLWVGGLAESPGVCLAAACPLLGETFSTVFRRQMEDLQAGDRLYYLSRLVGLNLGLQVESNTLSEIIQRNSDAENLPALIMTTADYSVVSTAAGTSCPTVEVRNLRNNVVLTGLSNTVATMVSSLNCRLQALPGANGKNIVYGGSDSLTKGDNIRAGNGDDTVRGNSGNDIVNAGDGNNQIYGGDGNDVLIDSGNSSSIGVLNGGDGNDVLVPGNGLKGNNPGRGDDVVIAGVAPTVALMGLGNDKFLGNDTGNDGATGDDGSDWLEGHGGLDALTGDAGAVFGIDTVKFGSDYLWGGSANDVLDGGGASDILGEGDGGAGSDTMTGGFGWDWVTAQGSDTGAHYDGLCGNAVALTPVGAPGVVQCPAGFVDAFIDPIEGMVGGPHDDYMRGDDALTYAATVGIANSSNDLIGSDFYTLSETGSRVSNGLNTVLGIALPNDNATAVVRTGNIMLGGDGSDQLMGGGGNDTIYGDGTQLVQLRVPNAAGGYVTNTVAGGYSYVTSMNDLVDGKTVRSLLETQTVSPGDLIPVIDYSVGTHGTELDTAIYSLGPVDYSYVANADGSLTVTQVTAAVGGGGGAGGVKSDDSDRLYGIEQLQFLNLNTTAVTSAPVDITHGLVSSEPTSVTAVPANSTSALVTWAAPAFPNTALVGAITNYTMFVTNMTPGAGLPVTGTSRGTGNQIVYTVANAGGNAIAVGDVVSVSGSIPGLLNVSNAVVTARTNTTVTVASPAGFSTAGVSEPGAGARLIRATATTTANAATLSATIPALTTGTTYSVAVRANSGVNLGVISAPALVTPAVVAPSVVRNVSAVNTGVTSISVSWQAPIIIGDASTPTYQVDLTDTSNGNTVATNVCNWSAATTCAVTGLITDHQYSIVVYARNGALMVSPGSTPVTVAPSAFSYPGTPSGVVLQTAGATRVAVDWQAPTSFGRNQTSATTSYVVTATAAGRPTVTVNVAAGQPLATYITGLVTNVAYTVSIVAVNTNPTNATPTLSNRSLVAATGTITTNAATNPGAPTAIAVGAGTTVTDLPISWTPPTVSGSDRIASYTARAYTAAINGTLVGSCVSSGAIPVASTCTIPGLNSGTQYWVTVVATNAASLSSTEPTTRTVTGFTPGGSITTSVLTASAGTIVADGATKITLSLQLRNSAGTALTTNGIETPTFANTGLGTINNVRYSGSAGIWLADFTAPIEAGAANVITAKINGVSLTTTPVTITLSSQVVDAGQSTIAAANPIMDVSVLNANTITVTEKTLAGLAIAGQGVLPTFVSSSLGGSVGTFTSQGAGVWTATYTAPVSTANNGSTDTITVAVNGTNKTTTVLLSYLVLSPTNSRIYTDATDFTSTRDLEVNGVNSATITVQLKDSISGNLVAAGPTPVFSLSPTIGSITGLTSNGSGKWTATYTPPADSARVPVTISATVNGTSIGNTAVVTLMNQTPSSVRSTFTPTSASLEANGLNTTKVTLQYFDAANVKLTTDGPTPELSVGGAGGSISAATLIGAGKWEATYTAPKTGSPSPSAPALIEAWNGGTKIATASVTLTKQTASASQSYVVPTDLTLEANGFNTTAITVYLRDASGEPLAWAGDMPVITASSGAITGITSQNAGVNGIWTATYTAPASSGTATITASITGVGAMPTRQITLTSQTVSAANSTVVTGDPILVTANGSSVTTVEIQLKDSATPARNLLTAGTVPTFILTPNVGTISGVVYSGSGKYSATYTAPGTNAGSDVVVTGLLGSSAIAGSRTITLVAQSPDPATSLVERSVSSLEANGVNTATITVRLKDQNSVALLTCGPQPLLAAAVGTFLGSPVCNANNGVWTQSYQAPSSVSGSPVAITATYELSGTKTIAAGTSIALVAPTVSTATSTVTTSTASVEANGVNLVRVTVTPLDSAGQPVTPVNAVGNVPSFSVVYTTNPTGAPNTFTPVTWNSGAGTWSADYRVPAESAANKTIEVTARYGSALTNKASFALTLPAVSQANSTVTVSNPLLATQIVGSASGNGTRVTYPVNTSTQNIVAGDFVTVTGFTTTPALNVKRARVDSVIPGVSLTVLLSGINGTEVAPAAAAVFKETTSASVEADGLSTAKVYIVMRDANNVAISTDRSTALSVATDIGTISSATYIGSGTWEATYTSPAFDATPGAYPQTPNISADFGVLQLAPGTLTLVAPAPNTALSALSMQAASITVPADVTAPTPTSKVYLELRNIAGQLLNIDNQEVTFSSKQGTFGIVSYDSTSKKYWAEFTPNAKIAGRAKIGAKIGGQSVKSTTYIDVANEIPTSVGLSTSVVTASRTSIVANGTSQIELAFALKNGNGEAVTNSDNISVKFWSSKGMTSPIVGTYQANGVWTASWKPARNSLTGDAQIVAMVTDESSDATFTDVEADSSDVVAVLGASVSGTNSKVTATARALVASTTSNTKIYLDLMDNDNVKLGARGGAVTFTTNLGSVGAATYDAVNDRWFATYQAPTGVTGTATIWAMLNSSPMTSVATVTITSAASTKIAVTSAATATRNKKYSAAVTFPSKFTVANTTITVKTLAGKKVVSSTSTQRGKSKASVTLKLPKTMKAGTYVVTVTVKVGTKTYSSSSKRIRVK